MSKRKHKKIVFLWKKHPECKVEHCKTGYTLEHYNSLCGGSVIRKVYCQRCCELWEKEYIALYEKIEGRTPRILPMINLSPEEMMQYIKKNQK
jgi:hypothetical protein